MSTSVYDFDYDLPRERIAQSPAIPRESARLMVLDRKHKTIQHMTVANLPDYFRRGDTLVVNNTKVFRARLHGSIKGKRVELFLVRPIDTFLWLALGKPGKKYTIGSRIDIADDFVATIFDKRPDGTVVVSFDISIQEVMAKANRYGDIPIPPYIKKIPTSSEYQTSFAKHEGSVAAPTAGFHFTQSILSHLKAMGVTVLEITLHVGLGTFLPIKSKTIEGHDIHSEWVDISKDVARQINKAKDEKRRVIAVGTTTVRTLEGVSQLSKGRLRAYQGEVSLFISPGFQFTIVDSMVTNFHLPKSTLIVLVSAFAGREFILSAYSRAVMDEYRFYSFGDAMLIL